MADWREIELHTYAMSVPGGMVILHDTDEGSSMVFVPGYTLQEAQSNGAVELDIEGWVNEAEKDRDEWKAKIR